MSSRTSFKTRHYGLLALGNVNTRLLRAQQLLGPVASTTADRDDDHLPVADNGEAPETRSTSDPTAPKCPHCGGRLVPLSPGATSAS